MALDPTNPKHERTFPASWTVTRKQAAANQLNAIASITGYATLSSDAREVLGRLPGNKGTTWDNGLRQRDWAVRASRASLDTSDTPYFPVEWRADNADNNQRQRRQDIATALNQLNDLDQEEAVVHYHNLSPDDLRVLAGLPGNERAFTQLTIQPLDPQELDPENPTLLRWRNRRGPDDPDDFQVPDTSDPLAAETLRVYIDTLDGRSTNRYFYRAAFVDGVHNRSDALSLASPPVYLPKFTPPRTPVITKVLGDDRKIILRWISNREPDLLEYRVYRTKLADAARDLRLMGKPIDIVAADSDPAARPTEVMYTDAPVPGLTNFWYRVIAVDSPNLDHPHGGGNNASEPSQPVMARATQSPPTTPTLDTPVWDSTHTNITLEWQIADLALEARIERRTEEGASWFNVTGWLPAGQMAVSDAPPDSDIAYDYRVRVRDHAGQQAVSNPQTTP
jgi:hypothetical protein